MTHAVSLSKRLYDAIKAELRTGFFLPGQPIPAARFARQLSVSIIPVREALYRLAGERLVEIRDHGGFHAPHLTESRLRDLYQAQMGMLLCILDGARPPLVPPGSAENEHESDTSLVGVERLFAQLAITSHNRELQWLLANLFDRLRVATQAKARVSADWPSESTRLLTSWQRGDRSAFRKTLLTYHRRRMALVPGLVEHLYLGRVDR